MNTKYVDDKILRYLDQLIFEINYPVDGKFSGRHKSLSIGKSLEFVQHREYVHGDDLKYIDWKVYGRKDKFFIKQFYQETNLVCNIMLDCSSSMWFKSNLVEYTKYEYASFLCSYISYILLNQNDSVGVMRFDNKIQHQIKPRSGKEHYYQILNFLNDEYKGGGSNFLFVLENIQNILPKRSLLIIISDLVSDEKQIVNLLKKISFSGVNLMVVHVVDPIEKNLSFGIENITFEDIEEINPSVKTNIEEIRSLYLQEFNKLVEYFKQELNSTNNTQYYMVETDRRILENIKFLVFT